MMLVVYILIGIATVFFMEFVAWFSHKYIMHGLGWFLHKDHHQKTEGFFEKNDLFFVIFAIPSWLTIMFGWIYYNWYVVSFGFGIAAYGVIYFLAHDVLVHRRFKWLDGIDNRYFKAIRMSHKVHHKNRYKEGGSCFGFLIIPKKYFKKQ